MVDTRHPGADGYIEPIGVDDLALALEADGKPVDPRSRALLAAEADYVRQWRARARGQEQPEGDPENLVGLALSGGGIRSATFALGVMQALARHNLLSRVDYLSTVSGGGYIGSALSWLLSKKARDDFKTASCEDGGLLEAEDVAEGPGFGPDRDSFPYGTDDPAPGTEHTDGILQRNMLRYLRRHGDYLAPGAGISIVSLLAVILRGIFLNLLVWVPVFVLLFLGAFKLSEGVIAPWHPAGDGGTGQPVLLAKAFAAMEPATACNPPLPSGTVVAPPEQAALCADLKTRQNLHDIQAKLPKLFLFEYLLYLGVGILAVLLAGAVVYSLLTVARRRLGTDYRATWYAWRRSAEKHAAFLLPLLVACLLAGTLPMVSAYLENMLLVSGPLAMVAGLVAVLRNFLKSMSGDSGTPLGLLVSVGAGLFLYGFLLVAYHLAFTVYPDPAVPHWAFYAGFALAAVTGLVVNLNYTSIHRFYRDRLMESFMPDVGSALCNTTGAAQGADGAALHDFATDQVPRGPYHIINTNVVLVNSGEEIYRQRGGDNFILSPLYCGSNATGWRRTSDYMGGKMTLATAMAISGAAANPNAGVGGAGLTRNLFLSLVMSLLNLRLGYWACHPRPSRHPSHNANHFRPGAYAFAGVLGARRLGYNEQRAFLELSDGGHFENTGVYELVRRRAKLIVVSDAAADAEFAFSDFQTTVNRIQDDFGARIKVAEYASPDEVMPGTASDNDSRYPMNVEFAKQGHMVATITYADGSQGTLIYLKAVLTPEVSFKVKGYAAQNPEFPHQSTADQFFDDVQFESYRELGYRLADSMLGARVPQDIPETGTLGDLIRNC